MDFSLQPISQEDREALIDIFNYYVDNSFSAYPETKVPYDFFDTLLEMAHGYPTVAVRDKNNNLIGFGMLRRYSPFSTFSQTAEISYFISPNYTGKGIGTAMLLYLVRKARQSGLTSILASVSSLNEDSIRFHSKNGFVECGRFCQVGTKKGQVFDVVYMQRMI